ncbi:hypothetical protein F383_35737 [Gossypium arboreum]|nr:hypothetical protein F383_35737 [Gossypium arboreum]
MDLARTGNSIRV